MKRKLKLLALALGFSVSAAVAADVTVYLQNESNWANCCVYTYGGEDQNKALPGVQVTLSNTEVIDGQTFIKVKVNGGNNNLIFNNGTEGDGKSSSAQTGDLNLIPNGIYYTRNKDNVSYSGNPTKQIKDGKIVDYPYVEPGQSYTLYYKVPSDNRVLNIYTWSPNLTGTYPGYSLKEKYETVEVNGDSYYKIVFSEEPKNIQFNNGGDVNNRNFSGSQIVLNGVYDDATSSGTTPSYTIVDGKLYKDGALVEPEEPLTPEAGAPFYYYLEKPASGTYYAYTVIAKDADGNPVSDSQKYVFGAWPGKQLKDADLVNVTNSSKQYYKVESDFDLSKEDRFLIFVDQNYGVDGHPELNIPQPVNNGVYIWGGSKITEYTIVNGQLCQNDVPVENKEVVVYFYTPNWDWGTDTPTATLYKADGTTVISAPQHVVSVVTLNDSCLEKLGSKVYKISLGDFEDASQISKIQFQKSDNDKTGVLNFVNNCLYTTATFGYPYNVVKPDLSIERIHTLTFYYEADPSWKNVAAVLADDATAIPMTKSTIAGKEFWVLRSPLIYDCAYSENAYAGKSAVVKFTNGEKETSAINLIKTNNILYTAAGSTGNTVFAESRPEKIYMLGALKRNVETMGGNGASGWSPKVGVVNDSKIGESLYTWKVTSTNADPCTFSFMLELGTNDNWDNVNKLGNRFGGSIDFTVQNQNPTEVVMLVDPLAFAFASSNTEYYVVYDWDNQTVYTLDNCPISTDLALSVGGEEISANSVCDIDATHLEDGEHVLNMQISFTGNEAFQSLVQKIPGLMQLDLKLKDTDTYGVPAEAPVVESVEEEDGSLRVALWVPEAGEYELSMASNALFTLPDFKATVRVHPTIKSIAPSINWNPVSTNTEGNLVCFVPDEYEVLLDGSATATKRGRDKSLIHVGPDVREGTTEIWYKLNTSAGNQESVYDSSYANESTTDDELTAQGYKKFNLYADLSAVNDDPSASLDLVMKQNGVKSQSYRVALSNDSEVAVEDIEAEEVEENAAVEVYTVNGMKADADNLQPGLYIVRKGTKTYKVMVK